jgi:hypothetical protein
MIHGQAERLQRVHGASSGRTSNLYKRPASARASVLSQNAQRFSSMA